MKKRTRNYSQDFQNLKLFLGKNIRTLRKQLHISQEELAHRVNIDRTYMSGIERGLRNPSLSVLCDLARELNTNAKELLTDVEKDT